MNSETLQRMLSPGEGQSLEYKTSVSPSTIGRAVCAFLNSDGGFVICGIQDEIFVRERSDIRRADIDTIRDMVLRRQVEPERWERRFSGANLKEDLDLDEIRNFIQAATHHAEWFSDSTKSPIEVLERLGMIKYGRLTNGGDVLFATAPAIRRPQVRVQAAAFAHDTSDDTYQDLKNFEGPLVQVLEQAYAFIQRNTPSRNRFNATGLARQAHSLYPPEAVREGLVNAFAHRDYTDFGGGIGIHVYPDRLEIQNAGLFPKNITPAILAQGHISVLRNPDIAHVLYLRGMMEKMGRGSIMIRKACEKNGLQPPRWHADDQQGVTLTLFATEVTTEVTTALSASKTPNISVNTTCCPLSKMASSR